MKILTVIGARPQFVKAAVISNALEKADITEILVNTGQHYDHNMAGQFVEDLNMKQPQYDLEVGQLSRARQLSEMILKLEEIISREEVNLVMVYGDTTSTLAGALAASCLNVSVAHVEAGLRSYDKTMPEEINRILTDNISDILFCPTKEAVSNIEKENISGKVFNVGDIMYELAIEAKKMALKESNIFEKLKIGSKDYVLATIHRQANVDDEQRLLPIIEGFCSSEKLIVFPVHPRTKKMLKNFNLLDKIEKCENVCMIDPVGYMDMICLEMNAEKIVTDSGGVQKEAYFYEVPCVTIRDNTEWVETLENGWNILVEADAGKIKEAIRNKRCPSNREDYYGDGLTAEKIIKILKEEVKSV